MIQVKERHGSGARKPVYGSQLVSSSPDWRFTPLVSPGLPGRPFTRSRLYCAGPSDCPERDGASEWKVRPPDAPNERTVRFKAPPTTQPAHLTLLRYAGAAPLSHCAQHRAVVRRGHLRERCVGYTVGHKLIALEMRGKERRVGRSAVTPVWRWTCSTPSGTSAVRQVRCTRQGAKLRTSRACTSASSARNRTRFLEKAERRRSSRTPSATAATQVRPALPDPRAVAVHGAEHLAPRQLACLEAGLDAGDPNWSSPSPGSATSSCARSTTPARRPKGAGSPGG